MKRWFFLVLFSMLVSLAFAASTVFAAAKTEKKVITIWDYNIHDKKYKTKAFKDFNKDHPDIEVKYVSQVGGVYDQVLMLAMKVGEEPDLYIPAGSIPTQKELIAQKRILAIDDVAPDSKAFLAWKARFPQAVLRQGEIGGKLYTWPIGGFQSNARPLFVNLKLTKQAGLPGMPRNWQEFRDFAAKITQAGRGSYFGISIGALRDWVIEMNIQQSTAEAEGSLNGYWDYRIARWQYNDALRRSIDLWMAVKKDGSVLPGETTIEDEQAKSNFALGKAAMMVGGPWNPGGFLAYSPQIEFDMELFPTSDGGPPRGYAAAPDPNPVSGDQGEGGFGYLISAKTKYPDAVWKLIEFMTSEEYQVGWIKAGGGVSVFQEFNRPEYFAHITMAKFAQNYLKWDKIKPKWPAAMQKLNSYMPSIHPTDRELYSGIWIGLKAYRDLVDYGDKMNRALDEAVKKAQAEGVKVTRADFMVSDWDPLENYPPPKKAAK